MYKKTRRLRFKQKKKLNDSISAHMVKTTDGWPHELLYNAIWKISHSWTNSLLELMDVICAPALPVYFPFDICKQILYRAYFWHVCRIVSFCNYGDVVFRKPVLDRVSIMRGRQVGPKYILTSTMIFSKEWHQSLFNTLFQVDVLVDGLFTRRNVNLTNSFCRNHNPKKYFFFKFGLFPVGDVRRCQSAITRVVCVASSQRGIGQREVGLVVHDKFVLTIFLVHSAALWLSESLLH